jgi:TolB-like protein/DNA-binding winged helix-turn-helix (wHTH) protein/Flp pilus assembly protein TadD
MGSGEALPSSIYRFGDDFVLDLRAYELRRSSQPLKLPRIPMEVLSLLIEQRGQLVTREQIVEKVWGKEVFLDTDNSINAAIRKVRQVLNDDSEQPRFVQTVTGRGYRFIAPVTEIGPQILTDRNQPILSPFAGELPTPVSTPSEEGLVEQTPDPPLAVPLMKPVPLRWALGVGIPILLVGALLGYFRWFRTPTPSAQLAGHLMLAVLPFSNLTGDATQEYFSDGLTEEMIAQLGRLNPERVSVTARTSVMHYKNEQVALDQIAHDLGAQYVLEGSVRRDSEKVRVTAQLIRVKDQTHVWTRSYDRELRQLLALEREIAHEISDEIQGVLDDSAATHPTFNQPALSQQDYEAYDLYLKGLYALNKRTPRSLDQAISYFQQATEKNPRFAQAYAGLADSYALSRGYSLTPESAVMSKARTAALRALEIDNSLAEAHTALGLIVQNYDWDWQTAEKEFRRAIQLNPNYATAHHWYAEHLAWRGRFDEAFEESERARQLDPLSLIIATDNGAILYLSRQYERAIQKCQAVLEMEPNFPRAHLRVFAYAQQGRYQDALADIEQWRKVQEGPWIWVAQAYVYGRSGQQAQARRALAKLERFNRRQSIDPGALLFSHIGMGNNDLAFATMEKAYAQHSNVMTTLKVDPIFDPLRSDPRFADFTHRVGLSE